jgi:hypothetical protein
MDRGIPRYLHRNWPIWQGKISFARLIRSLRALDGHDHALGQVGVALPCSSNSTPVSQTSLRRSRPPAPGFAGLLPPPVAGPHPLARHVAPLAASPTSSASPPCHYKRGHPRRRHSLLFPFFPFRSRRQRSTLTPLPSCPPRPPESHQRRRNQSHHRRLPPLSVSSRPWSPSSLIGPRLNLPAPFPCYRAT